MDNSGIPIETTDYDTSESSDTLFDEEEENITVYRGKLSEELFEAAKNNDVDKVKQLIQNGADPNSYYYHSLCESEETHILAECCLTERPNLELIKLLVSSGASMVNSRHDGNNLLLQLVHHNYYIEILKMFIDDFGLDINTICPDNFFIRRTILHEAAAFRGDDNFQMFEFILEHGANINNIDGDGRTPLWCALSSSKINFANVLLKMKPTINVKYADKFGNTILHMGSLAGHFILVKILLEYNADVNVKDVFGWTPLHYAAGAGHTEIAKLLIDNGADVNARDGNGNTPLCYAKSYEIAELFIDNGANVNARDGNGNTPLYYIRIYEIVKLLIDKGANVNIKSNDEDTPLHYTNNYEIARLFIDNGADVNVKNHHRDTPLHYVEKYEIAKLLLEYGADVNIQNDDYGYTPLHCVIKCGKDINLIKLLLSYY